jgi:ribonuclease HI
VGPSGNPLDLDSATKPILQAFLDDIWNSTQSAQLHASRDWPPQFHATTLQRHYEKLSTPDRRLLAQLLAGTVYTHQRAQRIGAGTDGLCPVCGVDDTITHRLVACSASDSPSLSATDSSLSSLLPILPPPDDFRCPPCYDPAFFHISVARTAIEIRRVDHCVLPASAKIFTDGSCIAGLSNSALAAGAAVALAEGSPLYGTYHAIAMLAPPSLPQTSFAGEYTGISLALQSTQPARTLDPHLPTTIVTDSAAALTGFDTVRRRGWVDHRRRWDGLWGDLIRLTVPDSATPVSLEKVKAHQVLKESLPADTQVQIVGNMVADRLANHMIADFTYPSRGKTVKTALSQWRHRLDSAIVRLRSLRENLPPVPRPDPAVTFARTRATIVPVTERHHLVWSGNKRSCSKCLKVFTRPDSHMRQCSGLPTVGPGIVAEATSMRHNMAVVLIRGRLHGPLAICLRCGAFSMQKVRNLRLACPGSLGTRRPQLQRLLAGFHPSGRHSVVSAVLRPWPRSNRQQRRELAIPPAMLASSSSTSSASPAVHSSCSARPPGSCFAIAASSSSAADDEWDASQLAAWVGSP